MLLLTNVHFTCFGCYLEVFEVKLVVLLLTPIFAGILIFLYFHQKHPFFDIFWVFLVMFGGFGCYYL